MGRCGLVAERSLPGKKEDRLLAQPALPGVRDALKPRRHTHLLARLMPHDTDAANARNETKRSEGSRKREMMDGYLTLSFLTPSAEPLNGRQAVDDLNMLISQMTLKLANIESSEDTVETVAYYARAAVKADDAGVMLVHAHDRVETAAGTSEEVNRAHQLQAEQGEGPCLAAVMGGDEIYVVANTLDDKRWPTWGKAAADMGYYSVVSASMHTGSRRIGSLNAYSRSLNAFTDSDIEVIGLLSSHATHAIAAAKRQEELKRAVGSRTLIGQAQGILMQAYGIDATTAFSYLRRLSQDQNVKLIKIAEIIIENRPDIGRDAPK